MTTINRLPITKARINLGQIARRAHNGKEYFILEKDGIPVIGIMAAAELEDYLESLNSKLEVSVTPSPKGREGGISRLASKLLSGFRRRAVGKTT
jgi:antitoxin (DNA-binding transcriptional repressor) of toxin-antitoxin stability system